MAKADKSRLEAARDELKKIEKVYDKLVRHNTAPLSEIEKQKHYDACREALIAKKEAKRTVESLESGIPVTGK